MDHDFEKYLDELEELLEESWNLPIANNKYIINGEKLRAIISNIKLKLPGEMKRSREILQKREEIMLAATNEAKAIMEKAKKDAELLDATAKNGAKNLIERAKVQAETMISEQEIVRAAEERANQMLESARADALKMKKVTINYVESSIEEAQRSLENSLNAVNQAKKTLNGSKE